MNNDDHTHRALPTPPTSTASTVSFSENSQDPDSDVAADYQDRATSAVRSILQISGADDMLQTSTSRERHMNALVSLSGALLSKLLQIEDGWVREQITSDVADYVLDAIATCTGKPQATFIAQFILDYARGRADPPPATDDDNQEAISSTPEDDAQVTIESSEEQQESKAAEYSASPAKTKVQHKRIPIPLDYDPAPIAKLSAKFVSDLFGSDTCPETSHNYTPTLSEYIRDAITTARIDRSVTIYALGILDRLHSRQTGHVNIPYGTFGLFMTAYMIAGKLLNDCFCPKSWYRVGRKLFTLEQLAEMERSMCGDLRWNVFIGNEELKALEEKIQEHSDGETGHVRFRAPTPELGSSAPATESTPASASPSSPILTSTNSQAPRSELVPVGPQPSTSSDLCAHSGADSSPLPSAPCLTPARRMKRSKYSELIWIVYTAADYEGKGRSNDVNRADHPYESGYADDEWENGIGEAGNDERSDAEAL
ncbi:unnamed protein product [Rhizoctonia solani]|uniref:Cyclin N-terminal domain-containing protein n=1 Tax=Rhizoctonia solani TaxID=456999 RepID=A0A8H3E3F5_9AGAM|nr:unnamed protein product [Rhizoctonia solani]